MPVYCMSPSIDLGRMNFSQTAPDPEESVTGWFHALRDGDSAAAQQLWKRYFSRIIGLARQQLPRDAAYDGEDFAVSVFDAVCRAATEGRCDELDNRDELWALIIVIARRKIVSRNRRVTAKRRSGDGDRPIGDRVDLAEVADSEPTAEVSAIVEDECRRLLDMLGDEQLESIALLRLEGYSAGEIASRLKTSRRTVMRRLAMIRKAWEQEVSDD